MIDLQKLNKQLYLIKYICPLLWKWSKHGLQAIIAMPQDWIQLISVFLENSPQLLWHCYFREEANFKNNKEKKKDLKFPQIKFGTWDFTLILRINLFPMNTFCPYVAQQI